MNKLYFKFFCTELVIPFSVIISAYILFKQPEKKPVVTVKVCALKELSNFLYRNPELQHSLMGPCDSKSELNSVINDIWDGRIEVQETHGFSFFESTRYSVEGKDNTMFIVSRDSIMTQGLIKVVEDKEMARLVYLAVDTKFKVQENNSYMRPSPHGPRYPAGRY